VNAPPAGAGCVGGVFTVRLSLGFGSLPRSLGRSLVQAVSVLGLQPLGRLPLLRSEPAKPAKW